MFACSISRENTSKLALEQKIVDYRIFEPVIKGRVDISRYVLIVFSLEVYLSSYELITSSIATQSNKKSSFVLTQGNGGNRYDSTGHD